MKTKGYSTRTRRVGLNGKRHSVMIARRQASIAPSYGLSVFSATHEVHLVAHPKCVRVLEGLPGLTGLHPLRAAVAFVGRLLARGAAAAGAVSGAVVVNAASWVEYSGTPALVARLLGAHGVVVGPAVGPARGLMDVAVSPREDTRNEVAQRLHLLSPVVDAPAGAMAFRTPRSTPAVDAVVAAYPRFAVVNPGGLNTPAASWERAGCRRPSSPA